MARTACRDNKNILNEVLDIGWLQKMTVAAHHLAKQRRDLLQKSDIGRMIAVLRRSHEICKVPVSLHEVIHQFASCGSSSSPHTPSIATPMTHSPSDFARLRAAGERR